MTSRRFDRFIAALASVHLSDRACNQYTNPIHRSNLRHYLEALDEIGPDMLLIGEAPSYRGGRLTGIPFTSERIMLSGILPGSGYRKATPGPEMSTEASATMVWGTICRIHPLPLLWNAFPFHPFDRGNPRSNRLPSMSELLIGQDFIRVLMRLLDFQRIVAIGNRASLSLSRMNIAHERVRHPSQGGKQKFLDGMARLSQSTASGDPMPRKNQIQQIKEGRSMRERTYTGRNQPAGPKAPLPTKNAVKLSTVPSSAKEKYRGGRD
jgi:uracil-DNA glycosylase